LRAEFGLNLPELGVEVPVQVFFRTAVGQAPHPARIVALLGGAGRRDSVEPGAPALFHPAMQLGRHRQPRIADQVIVLDRLCHARDGRDRIPWGDRVTTAARQHQAGKQEQGKATDKR